jgi:hypothetical protein
MLQLLVGYPISNFTGRKIFARLFTTSGKDTTLPPRKLLKHCTAIMADHRPIDSSDYSNGSGSDGT